MTESSVVRNIVVGKNNFIESWPMYKRVMLSGSLCLLSIIFGLMYLLVDMAFGLPNYLYAYLILMGGSVLSIVMLRGKWFIAGRLFYLITNISVLVLFAMVESGNTGIYLFFLVTGVASMTIFGHDRLGIGIVLSAFILILFLLLYFGNWSLIDPLPVDEGYYRVTYGINFTISLLLITLMIHYLITINHKTLTDIRTTEKNLIRLTHELSESRNRFQLALKGSSAGIWDWDAVNDKLYMSPLLNKILGYGLEQTIEANRKKFMDIIHPEDAEMVENHLNEHLINRTKFEVEFRLRHGEGHYIWVLDTGQAEWDTDGKPLRMVGSIVDITERRDAVKQVKLQNEMLEKANAELDRFVYSVSHDLKSPLSSVLGLMSIADLSDDKDEIKDCIRMMRDRINALNGFIEEIIDYSRNTRTDAMIAEVQIYDMIFKIVEGLKFMDKMAQIDLQLDIDPSLTVPTDSSRLKIVLNNLIGNAIKYHNIRQEQPWIRISARVEDQFAYISVSDNGLGIDKGLRERIFDMFFRAHENSEGSGLGLYIAKEMILKLNGDIHVESEKNVGSSFHIKIPVLEMATE